MGQPKTRYSAHRVRKHAPDAGKFLNLYARKGSLRATGKVVQEVVPVAHIQLFDQSPEDVRALKQSLLADHPDSVDRHTGAFVEHYVSVEGRPATGKMASVKARSKPLRVRTRQEVYGTTMPSGGVGGRHLDTELPERLSAAPSSAGLLPSLAPKKRPSRKERLLAEAAERKAIMPTLGPTGRVVFAPGVRRK